MTEAAERVRACVLAAVEDVTGRSRQEVRPADRLLADLRMDADDFSYLFVPGLEKQLGVITSQDDWDGVVTVQDAIDVFVRKVDGQR